MACVMEKGAGPKPGRPGGFSPPARHPRNLWAALASWDLFPKLWTKGGGGGGGWWWGGGGRAPVGPLPPPARSKQQLVSNCPALQSPVKGSFEPPVWSPEALHTLLHNYAFVGDREGPWRGDRGLRQTQSQLRGSGPFPPPGPGRPRFSVLPVPVGGMAPEQEAGSRVTAMLRAAWGVCHTLEFTKPFAVTRSCEAPACPASVGRPC